MTSSGNLLQTTPPAPGAEIFEPLFVSSAVRITRIVSNEHASAPGFWYDQDDDEWVVVIAGVATLEFEADRPRELKKGDWIVIPAHTRHRIAQTSSDTLWLAVHAKTNPTS